METQIADLKEQQFHDTIRDNLVCFFIYVILCTVSYFIIKSLRKLNETDDCILDYEDAIADRVSISLCVFTLATCIGAVLLLPMSIVANEVIIIYPNSFYWKWLNSSLIHGLWNKIFLLSNISLFLFIPFAYFFPEAIGLPGYKKGLKARVIETCLLITVITLVVLGISYVISSIIDSANANAYSVLNLSDYHLPFLYSCISFIGVVFLLICTPLGFARLFAVVSHVIMKRTFTIDPNEQLDIIKLDEASIQRHIEDIQSRDPHDPSLDDYFKRLNDTRESKQRLNNLMKRSNMCRNLCFPLIMVLLLILTSSSILSVIKNTFFVMFGLLPTRSADSEKFNVGMKSLYTLGIVQTFFEIVLILYFISASLVGLYSLPILKAIKPSPHSTPMRRIILNCAIYLIFSSALPVSTKILGLTNFDLLGRFGELRWLCNKSFILLYNISFASATILCLANILTSKVRTQLYNRVLMLFQISFTNSKTPALNRSYSTAAID